MYFQFYYFLPVEKSITITLKHHSFIYLEFNSKKLK